MQAGAITGVESQLILLAKSQVPGYCVTSNEQAASLAHYMDAVARPSVVTRRSCLALCAWISRSGDLASELPCAVTASDEETASRSSGNTVLWSH
jgi:hypothetical protein